ncbi:hypothetical protein IWQ60_003860 [Tieghemiomyces parasiticus]|uniref:Uncharacterized protein n=1 Tax=Tieghemiomyces parasiticus TaxID=78921 RepID=A0A9W8A8V6_9FUNG|nr:hypothetical protein IWQ60_003860 [Tieghemiomyces parasiticus]
MAFSPFADRFYRVTETAHSTVVEEPASPFTDYTSYYWGTESVPVVTKSPAPRPVSPPAAAHTYVTYRPTTPPPVVKEVQIYHPAIDENVTDAHGLYTVRWHESCRPLKCGYVVEDDQFVVVADFGHTTMRHQFTLPQNADLENVTVSYHEGFFKAHVPRVSNGWKVHWLA